MWLIGICWRDSSAHVVSLVLLYMANPIPKHLVGDVLIKIEIQSLERPGSIVLIQRARERVVVLVLLSLITDAFRLKLKVIRLARYLVWHVGIRDAEFLVVVLLFLLAGQRVITKLALDGVDDGAVILGDILAIVISWSDIREVGSGKAVTIVGAVAIVSPIYWFIVTKARVGSTVSVCILMVELLHLRLFKVVGEVSHERLSLVHVEIVDVV